MKFLAAFSPIYFMKTAQLAYSIVMLSKVSFSETLFGKELRKCIDELSSAEKLYLYAWGCTSGRNIPQS
jgi:hypothetical protein